MASWLSGGPGASAVYMDKLRGPGRRLVVASTTLGAQTPDEWKDDYAARFGLDGEGVCDVLPADWPLIEVGGHQGWLAGDDCPGDGTVVPADRFYEAITFAGGRAYVLRLQGQVDRPMLERLLSSVRFDVDQPPAGAPSP
jgi:hypothetical protein